MDTSPKELLRLATAGSVDDGKSTLIGRLLLEIGEVYEDQLEALKKSDPMAEEVDLALLMDGLEAEREQGITIDVAYRYFSTPERQFILADSPGHVEYTRNFITAASTANVVVILVDAKKGLSLQTRRHLFLSSLMSVPHILIAVNKMDLVDYDAAVYQSIKEDIKAYSAKLKLRDLQFVPMSALKGDMVTQRGENMPWYTGQTFLNFLENLHIASDLNLIDVRLPVQLALRPHSDFRAYAGMMAGGVLKEGQDIMVLPSEKTTRVKAIWRGEEKLKEAFNGQSVLIEFEDEVDASRGDLIVSPKNLPERSNLIEAQIWWMDAKAMEPGKTYLVQHCTQQCLGFVETLTYKINVETLHREESAGLEMNEIGRITLKTHQPLNFDPYAQNTNTGSFILIDKLSHNTVAGGIILQRSAKKPEYEDA